MKRFSLSFLASLAFSAAAAGAGFEFPTLPLRSAAPQFHLMGVDGRKYSLYDFTNARLLVVIYRETGTVDALALKRALVAAMNEQKPW